jgi:hypothetical protein
MVLMIVLDEQENAYIPRRFISNPLLYDSRPWNLFLVKLSPPSLLSLHFSAPIIILNHHNFLILIILMF